MMKFGMTIVLAFAVMTVSVAQSLLPPVFTYSHKKTSYITLADGSSLEGTIKDVDRKKGLVEEVTILNGKGKKVKLKPEDIQSMYLPSSGWDKMGNAMDFLTNADRWDNDELDSDKIAQGYVYIEQAEVMVNKKRRTMLMQLLNPHFSSKIRVYHDPWAKETLSAGIGPVKMAGGIDKSYYVKKKSAQAAIRLKKKNYNEEFKGFYRSCKAVSGMQPKWGDFVMHVHKFSTECK